jgi:hypothetical protein
MTIDSGWVQILKKECPRAFSRKLGVTPTTWFIDGQIKLMKGSWIKTWDMFIQKQFIDTIDRAFEHSASVVVLGFDDYTHVPVCKSMTQRKRTMKQAVFTFDDKSSMPAHPPEDWASAMRNRYFKSKVVKIVVLNLTRHYADHDKTVIIDWMGPPVVLGAALGLSGRTLPEVLLNPDARRGECDIKALTWTTWGPLVVQSTDGDFVPLALIHCAASPESQVVLERIETNVTAPSKRDNTGRVKRQMEFVCVRALCEHVYDTLSTHENPCRTFAAFVALTGCDFSQSMAAIGPSKLWSARSLLRNLNLGSEHGLLNSVTMTYQHNFNKHIRALPHTSVAALSDTEASVQAYDHVYGAIVRNVSVAQKTKNAINAPHSMLRHVRNVLWTLEYWSRQGLWPDPMQEKYGFSASEKHECVFTE